MNLDYRVYQIGLVLLLLAAQGCSRGPASPRSSADGVDDHRVHDVTPPIILIVLSGLRPDAVGALGGVETWTPHIDALAREADWVGTTVVASSMPVVSLVSLMTGVPAWQHQVLSHEPARPRAGLPLLAQALGQAGYHTVARVPIDYRFDRFGLFEGFDEVEPFEPIGESVAALRRAGTEPVLYWLHLLEANVTYERRDAELPFLTAPSAELPRQMTGQQLWPYADPQVPLPAEERSALWELFGHEVAWADHQVGQISSALQDSGVWDRAWVIVTATQGTELGEHRQILYAQNLGRASLEVPLIIKLPRDLRGLHELPARSRVSQLRLWATLVEAAGGKADPVHAPSLFDTDKAAIISELYLRNGVNDFSFLDEDIQLILSTRFSPAEPEYFRAHFAKSGGRPAMSESPSRILGRLKDAFRHTLPFSGPVDGDPPSLRLVRWTERSVQPIEDRRLAEEMAGELRLRLRRFTDRERTPQEESSLSGASQ